MDTNTRTQLQQNSDRIARDYGVNESNPLWMSSVTHEDVDYSEGDVPLSDKRIVSIDRIRLLTDPGCPFFDVSYVYGTLSDGRHVRVDLGAHQLQRRNLNGQLIELAKAAGRFAKGLGMLDNVSILR